MIGLRIEEAKALFFDRKPVMDAMDKATQKALSKFGAFVRTRARSSLRRRKKPSEPGQAPSVHSTDSVASLKNILFSYQRPRKSVVIGPVKLNQVNLSATDTSRTTVPKILEFGEVVSIREESFNGQRWYRRDMRRRVSADKHYRTRKATYEPRPFMRPAFEKELPGLPPLWQNAVIQ